MGMWRDTFCSLGFGDCRSASDRASRANGDKVVCPMHVLWGLQGVVQRLFDPMALWQAQCSGPLSGRALDCGHFIPEALPDETATELLAFHG